MPIRPPTPEELSQMGYGEGQRPPESRWGAAPGASAPRGIIRDATPEERKLLGFDDAPAPTEAAATPPPAPAGTGPSMVRTLAGAGIRLGSNILGAEGGISGAGINALGEGAAELLEGSAVPTGPTHEPNLTDSPRVAALKEFLASVRAPFGRMGVAGAAGAVPGASLMKGGLAARAAKGALVAGGSTLADQLVTGQGVDPTSVATSTALGAGTGAILPKFFGGRAKPSAPTAAELEAKYPLPPGLSTSLDPKIRTALEEQFGREGTTGESVYPNKKVGTIEKQMAAQGDWAARDAREAIAQTVKDAKAKAAQDAAAKILADRAAAGVVPKPPSFGSSISAPSPEGPGRISESTRYGKPKPPTGATPAVTPATPAGPKTIDDLVAEYMAQERAAAGRGQSVEPTAPAAPVVPPEPVAPTPAATAPPFVEAPPVAPTSGTPTRPSRSRKTVTGFNKAVQDTLDKAQQAGPGPGVPPEAPEATGPLADLLAGRSQRVNPGMSGGGGRILKTRAGAAGINKAQAAQEAIAAGVNPAEDQAAVSARQALLREIEANKTGTPTSEPAVPSWVQEQLDRIKNLGSSETGAVNIPGIAPEAVSHLGRAALGAILGGVTGPMIYPDSPGKAMLGGGLLGGFLGSGYTPREILADRNASLLVGPGTVLKKHLSDIGTTGLSGLENMISGAGPALKGQGTEQFSKGANLLKELFRIPTNVSNYAQAFKEPSIARDVVGDAAKAAYQEPATNYLKNVTRLYAAPQYSTSEMFRRAGYTPEESLKALNMADPTTAVGKWWAQMQGNPYVQALRPFVRYATNLAEGGIERTPGLNILAQKAGMGDPRTLLGRNVLGLGALGAGAIQGTSEAEEEAQTGVKPQTPIYKQAIMARYLPVFTAGRALASSNALRELKNIYAPAIGGIVPQASGKDTLTSNYPKKSLDQFLGQILPDVMNPALDEQAPPYRVR